MTTPQKPKTPAAAPPPKGPKTPGEVVAEVFVAALSDPELEKKEAEAVAERDARLRAALIAQGRLPKPQHKGT